MSILVQPYLSIVVTTRNDNHGGDLLLRTQTFVKGLIHQCNKFNFFCGVDSGRMESTYGETTVERGVAATYAN
jgi:hypothetical protein